MQGRKVVGRFINASVNSSSCFVKALGMLFSWRSGEYPSSLNTDGPCIALQTLYRHTREEENASARYLSWPAARLILLINILFLKGHFTCIPRQPLAKVKSQHLVLLVQNRVDAEHTEWLWVWLLLHILSVTFPAWIAISEMTMIISPWEAKIHALRKENKTVCTFRTEWKDFLHWLMVVCAELLMVDCQTPGNQHIAKTI